MALEWILIIVAVIIVITALLAIPLNIAQQKEIKRTGKYPKGYYTNKGMAIGLALGVAMGIPLGNISLGIPIGLVLGLTIGMSWEKQHGKELRDLTKKEQKIKNYLLIYLSILVLLGLIAFLTVIFLIR